MPDAAADDQARQVQADAHDQQARAAADSGDDDGDDDGDDGTSGDDLPQYARKAVERANRQAAKWRKEAQQLRAQQEQEADERRKAQMTAEDRAREAEARAAQAQADAQAATERAQRLVALAGKVTHPTRVLRLMDDPTVYFDGDDLDIDRLLADFPEYAPQQQDQSPAPPARAAGAAGAAPRRPTLDDAAADLLARGDMTGYAAALATRQMQRRTRPKE